jgi:hypothetical protein
MAIVAVIVVAESLVIRWMADLLTTRQEEALAAVKVLADLMTTWTDLLAEARKEEVAAA